MHFLYIFSLFILSDVALAQHAPTHAGLPIFSLPTTTTVLPLPTQEPSSPVSVTTTHTNIHERFTKELTVNCSFDFTHNNEFSAVISLILSKTNTPADSVYAEISTITQLTPHTVDVKDNLGAKVTGQLVVGKEASIIYQWLYPVTRVEGNYRCTAFGMDKLGHPISAAAATVINERDVDLQMVLEKMKTLEISQDGLKQELNQTQAELGDVQHRLNNSASSVFANSTSFRGHSYFISHRMMTNVPMFEGLCQLYGGFLVDIADQQEFDVVVNLQKFTLPVVDVMLGMTDEGHEGNWTNIHSGLPLTFTNWYTGEPNTASYNCAYLDDSNVKIYDQVCAGTGIYRFICEIPK